MPLIVDQFDDWVTYVPEIGTNRLEQEPMTVEIQCMSTAEYKSVQRKWGPKLQGKNALSRAQRMVEKIIRERVRNVRLCFVENHTTGERFPLESGDDLIAHAPAALVDDIFAAITDASHLSSGLKKNSSSLSDFSAAEIPPSRGIVKPAKEKAESKRGSQGGERSGSSETVTVKRTQTLPGDSPPS